MIELPPLGALRTSPGTARAHVRAAVAAWRLDDDMADTAVLVTSELVTNAVQASTGPDGRPLYRNGRMAVVWVRLLSDGTRLIVEVWDQAPGYPQPRSAGADNTDGRGLHLVEALTGRQWGWKPARDGPTVKCVWAMVRPAMADMIA